MLTLTDLTIIRDKALFRPVTLTVKAGERIALTGPNGSGKSSLMALLTGASLEYEGSYNMPSYVEISRVDQHPRWQQGDLRSQLTEVDLEEGGFRQLMAALGVRGRILEQPLETLSQGQLKKLELARALSAPAHLLIWDEPLNYLDVDTREQLETALLKSAATMLLVEHDARFIDRIATRTLDLTP